MAPGGRRGPPQRSASNPEDGPKKAKIDKTLANKVDDGSDLLPDAPGLQSFMAEMRATLASMTTQISGLTATVADFQAQLSSITGAVESLKETSQVLTDRIAKLETSSEMTANAAKGPPPVNTGQRAGPQPSAWPAWTTLNDPWISRDGAPPPAGASHRQMHPSTPAAKAIPKVNPLDIHPAMVIAGFPRELPKTALKAHFEKILLHLDVAWRDTDLLQFGSYPRGTAYIIYVTRDGSFGSAMRDVQAALPEVPWEDPRGYASPDLRVSPRRDPQQAFVGKAFHGGWALLLKYLTRSPKFDQFRLKTDFFRKALMAESERDSHPLASVSPDDYSVTMNVKELEHFGLLQEEMTKVQSLFEASAAKAGERLRRD